MPTSFYAEDQEFKDRLDCSNCFKLWGMKIHKQWPTTRGNLLSIQWECTDCHERKFETLPFAETKPGPLFDCDMCAKKAPTLITFKGASMCDECYEIMRSYYQEG